MEQKKLKKAMDEYLGPFTPDWIKEKLLEAAREDAFVLDYTDSSDASWIIDTFNGIFKKKSRIMSSAVAKKYKTIFKHFTKPEIESAMKTASLDDFHKSNGYKYCTLEYFSRVDQMDKWLSAATTSEYVKQKEKEFILPKFNIKG
jgi:tRNA(His) 5'-end guanylyltransferase